MKKGGGVLMLEVLCLLCFLGIKFSANFERDLVPP